MSIVFLNGEYGPLEKAVVSVLDRGFIFGDGVYELIPCHGGNALRLQEHLQRLHNSLTAVRMDNPYSMDAWSDIIARVIEKNGGGDVSVYLEVTRGVAPRDHTFPEHCRPTVLVMAKPLPVIEATVMSEGIRAVTGEDIRWRYCHIKSISLLANVLMRQEALNKGAAECLLVRDGVLTEGSSSNVFVVDDQAVVATPPKSQFLLPGITRELLLELLTAAGLPCEERPISAEQLTRAKEVWISSSLREVQAVTELDGRRVGDGKPGPLWRRAYQLLQNYKQTLR